MSILNAPRGLGYPEYLKNDVSRVFYYLLDKYVEDIPDEEFDYYVLYLSDVFAHAMSPEMTPLLKWAAHDVRRKKMEQSNAAE